MDTNTTQGIELAELMDHASWLRGLARRLVLDAADAEDLVQETWLAALRRPPTDRRNLRGWLGRVATNVARGRRRRATEASLEEPVPTGEDPAELVEQVELGRDLAARVLELDEPYRETVLLRYWRGLDASAIAKRQGLQAGTVRWRLKVALDSLRDALDRANGGDRRAWMLAMVRIGSGGGELVTRTGSGLLLSFAGLALRASIWGLVVAMGLVLVVGAGALLGGLGRGTTVVRMPQDLRVPTRLATTGPATVEPIALAPTRTEVGSVGAAAVEAIPDVAAWVTVRAVAPDGSPIADARAELFGTQRVFASDANGTVRVALRSEDLQRAERRTGSSLLALVVGAPARELGSVEGHVARGDDVHFGEVVLGPGGSVSGVVVDDTGLPIQGAFVGVVSPTLLPDGSADAARAFAQHVDRYRFVESDADGRFTLHGVPSAPRRIAATREDWVGGVSAILEADPYESIEGVRLELRRDPAVDHIAGRVVGPDGEGVAHARIEYRGGRLFMPFSGTQVADERGRFVFETPMAGSYDIVAEDWRGKTLASERVQDLSAGRDDVLVTLGPATRMVVEVRSSDGALLPDADVYGEHVARVDQVEVGAGTHSLLAPNFPFDLTIEADHHDSFEFEDLDAAAVDGTLVVTLDALPGIRGRVVDAAGRPVAGARIGTQVAFTGHGRIDGFAARVLAAPFANGQADGESGPDGLFRVTERRRERIYVRFEAEGRAATELGPFPHDPERGLDLGDVVLTEGGVLFGRVFDQEGAPVPGAIVGINRGDGAPRTTRADAEGRYRFERLTPGEWQVRRRSREHDPDAYGSTSTHLPLPFDTGLGFDVAVPDGGAARYDLIPGQDGRTRITGRLEVDGRGAKGWSVAVWPDTGLDPLTSGGLMAVSTPEFLATPLGADGRFTVDADLRGPARVVFASGLGSVVWRDVELTGDALEVELSIKQSPVRFTGLALATEDEPLRLELAIVRGSDWTAVAQVPIDPDRPDAELPLPHGPLELRAFDPEALDDPGDLVVSFDHRPDAPVPVIERGR